MVQSLLGSVAVARVHLQQHADKILCVLRDVLPICSVEGEVPKAHLGQHIGVGLAEEGRVATQHHVHDHAAAPEVAQLVVLPREHLWRYVVRRASLCVKDLVRVELARQAKVDDLEQIFLDSFLGHEEEVLWLQVPMADVVLVHVIDGANYLVHQDGSLNLSEVARLDDAVEELPSSSQLHDQVDVTMVLEGLEELDNVRVIHHLHDSNLLLEAINVLHLCLGDRLDCTR
mmetsp:Transcript_67453/g.146974  ORF Transcript_67453/g.146974 Transcript_67453/m.146974 type:complete len:230 (-) Transcript_67453:306-995(-)